MEITELISNKKRNIVISEVKDKEFVLLTKKRYSFIWKQLKGKAKTYKLQIEDEDDILGVMALDDFPDESRIEIKLIASSKENVGRNKKYEGIIGCLIAFACSESLIKYNEQACVSLIPKTELKDHYINKYGMDDGGWQVFLEGPELNILIRKYIHHD
jgi:hypothetical protein